MRETMRVGLLGAGVGALLLAVIFAGYRALTGATTFDLGDSPIIVRGGSVNAHVRFDEQPTNWTLSSVSNGFMEYTTQYSNMVDGLELDRTGVYPNDKKGSAAPLTLTASTDWKISLFFRDEKGVDHPDSRVELDICSAQDCSTSGKISSTSKFIYLRAPTSSGNLVPETLESTLLHYSVNYCPMGSSTPGPGTSCDHASKITISGTFSPSTVSPILCIDGACDIKIGHPK